MKETLRVEGSVLVVGEERLRLDGIRRIVVVGAGKAGAGMAAAVEEVLGPQLMAEKNWPGGSTCRPVGQGLRHSPRNRAAVRGRLATCPPASGSLHAARPAGVNEPTPEGVAGADEILQLVESLGPDDLCLCLISGGGSALMPAPVEGITLADKLAVTRHLSAAGANIEQLNTVRKQLSRIKGGGLARACRAGRLVSLIISDVLGDPLDMIASGPTVADTSTPQAALAVLDEFARATAAFPGRVRVSRGGRDTVGGSSDSPEDESETAPYDVRHQPRHRQQRHGGGRGRAGGRTIGLFARNVAPASPRGRPKRSAGIWPKWPCTCGARPGRIASSAAASRWSSWSRPRAAAWADGTSSWCWRRWCA